MTANLNKQRQTIATALDDIPGGVKVLTAQRADITKLLVSLDKLGTVAVRVINASQANTVADLKSLQPILTQLNNAGNSLPKALELLTTYPFPRTVTEGVKGDYANLFITVNADLRKTAANQGIPLPATPPLPVAIPPITVPLPGGLPPISIGGSSPSPQPSGGAASAQPSPSPSGGLLPGITVPGGLSRQASPTPAPQGDLPAVRVPAPASSEPLLRLLVGGLS